MKFNVSWTESNHEGEVSEVTVEASNSQEAANIAAVDYQIPVGTAVSVQSRVTYVIGAEAEVCQR